MPITKILARDSILEIDGNLGVGSPSYVEIKGVTSITPNLSKNDADTTDFDSEGQQEHLPASRGRTFALSGFRMEDRDTGERDPGQQACEDAAELIGPEGLIPFRFVSPAGNVITFIGSVNVTPFGGGVDDPSAWSVEVHASGKPDFVAAGT